MLHSSLGFHTLSLSSPLMEDDAFQLIRDFRKYNAAADTLKIYYQDSRDGSFKIYHPRNDNTFLPNYIKIYYKDYNGIKWSIRYTGEFQGLFPYRIYAIINPKMMGGIHDYLTAATYDDMDTAITCFNLAAKKISPVLGNFSSYRLDRVDYCINFDLGDFMDECRPELVINLIKRGNIPAFYKEYMKYSETTHRTQSMPGSFYLTNKSVHINCYSKYVQLQELSRQKTLHGEPPIPQKTLDAAHNIIRFEIQYKWLKLYSLSRKMRSFSDHRLNKYEELLSHTACREAVTQYFKKTITVGDWWTLKDAVGIVSSQNFNRQKKARLAGVLQMVNRFRSIEKAKENCQDSQLRAFHQTLMDLSDMNINPVTIPKEWGIRHIPNLLYSYFEQAQKEAEIPQ